MTCESRWRPGTPRRFGSSWEQCLCDWGIPFRLANDAEGTHCLLVRPMDGRALDVVTRLHPYGYDGGMGEAAEKKSKQNRETQRAAFERARRDVEFLEALEAVAEARLFGGADDDAVMHVMDAQVPFERPRAWAHHVEWEEAADRLANAARAHLIAPSRLTAQMALRAIEDYEGAHKILWRRFEWQGTDSKRKLFDE